MTTKIKCQICQRTASSLTRVKYSGGAHSLCGPCAEELERDRAWAGVKMRVHNLIREQEWGEALRAIRVCMKRMGNNRASLDLMAEAISLQACVYNEAGDLKSALRSLKRREILPFASQDAFLCHQIAIVELLVCMNHYNDAQLRIRLALKRVYTACLPDALRLLCLYCLLPVEAVRSDELRYGRLLRRASKSFGIAALTIPPGTLCQRARALQQQWQAALSRHNLMTAEARRQLRDVGTSAALGVVKTYLRTEPLAFYKQLAYNQWSEYGISEEKEII